MRYRARLQPKTLEARETHSPTVEGVNGVYSNTPESICPRLIISHRQWIDLDHLSEKVAIAHFGKGELFLRTGELREVVCRPLLDALDVGTYLRRQRTLL